MGFILSDFPKSALSARYLINLFFLGPLIIALTLEFHWKHMQSFLKALIITVTILFFTTGITSNLTSLQTRGFNIPDKTVANLIHFLNKNNLDYGYGPYWGSQANAVTWLSNESIHLYPARFSHTTGFIKVGNRAQSSNLWKIEKLDHAFFVFIKQDSEECVKLEICLQGVEKQFGKPDKILRYEDAYIYVFG